MLTIIIPVFNEKKYLRLLLSKVISLKHIKTQIIVATMDLLMEVLKF